MTTVVNWLRARSANKNGNDEEANKRNRGGGGGGSGTDSSSSSASASSRPTSIQRVVFNVFEPADLKVYEETFCGLLGAQGGLDYAALQRHKYKDFSFDVARARAQVR